jgi:hypothetical protein
MTRTSVLLLLCLTTISMLSGCSSTPEMSNQQYCYTDEVIENNDGTVSSSTKVECTDRPIPNWKKQIGIADNCREYYYKTMQGLRRGYVCQRLDGYWEVVPSF